MSTVRRWIAAATAADAPEAADCPDTPDYVEFDEERGPVARRVRAALDESGAADDWRSATALTLAEALDDEPSASMSRELRSLMHDIAEATVPQEVSIADELRAKRAARTSAATA